MKKLLKRLLVFCIVASLALSGMSALADETDYKGTLSSYVRTFSESTDISNYLDVLGTSADGYFQSLYNDDGNMVLKLGDENSEAAKGYNSGGDIWAGTSISGVKLEFKVKRDSSKLGGFCVYGNNKDVYFMMQNKAIYFFGTKVSSYEADIWYDVKLNIDFSVGYASLSVKASTASEWFSVSSVASETFNNLMTITKDWKTMPSGLTAVSISHYRNTAKDRTVTYIDDLMVDEWTNDTGYRDFLEDDFDGVINVITDSTNEMTDSGTGWLADAAAGVTASDSAVLSVASGASGTISKKPFYSAPQVRQRFRFKLSAPTNGAVATVSASFNQSETQNTYLPFENAQKMSLLQIHDDKIVLGDEQYALTLSSDEMYDCEIVYSASDKTAKVSLADIDGTQYTGSAEGGLSAVFGTGSNWGNLSEFALSLTADNENNASVKFDDFDWDLGLNSLAVGNLAEEQNADNAPLDASILFTFGETVDSAETIGTSAEKNGSAKLAVFEEGEELNVPYTLEWVSEGLIKCTLANLSTAKNYSVSLTGVTLLSGDEADGISVGFKTVSDEVKASEPEFSNGTLSMDVSTGYAGGKTLTLIALEYDSTGALTGAKILEREVGADTQTLTISGISGCDKIGALLWSDFVTQVPYAKMKIFNVD